MKLAAFAAFLAVANPAYAQLTRHLTVEQASSAISGELVQPLYPGAPVDALPAAPTPFKAEQPKPILRTHTADKLFWLHSSAFAGSVALDAWSTSRLANFYRSHVNSPIPVPGICTEGNSSLGRTPTDGRIAGYFAAWAGGEVAATYVFKKVAHRFKPRWAHESWRFPITYLTAYHAFWGAANLDRCR